MRFIDSFPLVFKAPLKAIVLILFLTYIIGCGFERKRSKSTILINVDDSIHNSAVVKLDKSIRRNKNTDLARLGVINGMVKSYVEMDYSIKEATPKGQVAILERGVKYLFNNEGDMTAFYNYHRNGAFDRYEWTDCDSTGRIIAMYYHNPPDTTKINKVIYVYDKSGHLIEEDTYTATDSLFNKTIYTNDSHGNKITEQRYWSAQSNESVATSFVYDSADNLIEHFNGTNHYLFRYDSNGNVIENELLNTDGSIYRRITFEYDKYGNERENCENKEPCIHLKYEYDKYGNWTKRIIIKNDKPTGYDTRRIEYY